MAEARSKTRVLLWGLGAMGSGMASMLLENPDIEIVAAVARRPSRAGKDLGEIIGKATTGVKVTSDLGQAFRSRPDIVLLSTASFVEQVFPEIEVALEHDANVITIAEEMAFPWAASEELSGRIDHMAKQRGKTVLGTGINPGFVLDTLIIALTGICMDVQHIHGKRVNNLAPFGRTVMQTQGVGTTPEEFEQGLASGEIVGHVGFKQSLMLIGKALGWEIDEIVEEKQPIITSVERRTAYTTVAPGNVAGCRHTARAYSRGKELIFLEHPQQVCPEAEGGKTGDYITIRGTPPVNLAIEPEIPGGIGTMAIAVNMIPLVLNGPPGLVTMADLPIPRAMNTLVARATRD
ncbi:MAG TPA: NADP-binding protein [Firmicutes bacterium]|nr:NADP-binding protein [Candidatus Fermentithermobacillaceae bacterium]